MALRDVTLLGIEHETTVGTAETPLAADAAMNVNDCEIRPDLGLRQQMGQAGVGPLTARRTQRFGTCTFWIDLTGVGTASGAYAPFWARRLLPLCGYVDNEDGSFGKSILMPVGTSTTGAAPRTATVRHWQDGRYVQLYGAAGTLRISDQGAGPMRGDVTLQGLYDDPDDQAVPAWTPPSGEPILRFQEVTTLIGGTGGWNPPIAGLTLDLNNRVEARPYASAPKHFSNFRVVEGMPTGTLDPEASLVATYGLHAKALAETELALSMVIGSTAGSVLTIAASYLQFDIPQPAKRDEILVDETAFQLNRNSLTFSFS